MENNNKTKLTHKQKMDLVTKGLYFLTTQEVDALIKTIEAFKAREDSGKPRLDDLATLDLKSVPTCDLVAELEGREGVDTYVVGLEDRYFLQIAYPETKTCGSVGETGPARILVVID